MLPGHSLGSSLKPSFRLHYARFIIATLDKKENMLQKQIDIPSKDYDVFHKSLK